MSNKPSVVNSVILNTETDSAPVELNDQGSNIGFAIVGVICPAAAANATYALQGQADGTWRAVTDKDGNAVEITFTLNAYVWLDPAITAGFDEVRLVGTVAEGADRTFKFVKRGVQ